MVDSPYFRGLHKNVAGIGIQGSSEMRWTVHFQGSPRMWVQFGIQGDF